MSDLGANIVPSDPDEGFYCASCLTTYDRVHMVICCDKSHFAGKSKALTLEEARNALQSDLSEVAKHSKHAREEMLRKFNLSLCGQAFHLYCVPRPEFMWQMWCLDRGMKFVKDKHPPLMNLKHKHARQYNEKLRKMKKKNGHQSRNGKDRHERTVSESSEYEESSLDENDRDLVQKYYSDAASVESEESDKVMQETEQTRVDTADEEDTLKVESYNLERHFFCYLCVLVLFWFVFLFSFFFLFLFDFVCFSCCFDVFVFVLNFCAEWRGLE